VVRTGTDTSLLVIADVMGRGAAAAPFALRFGRTLRKVAESTLNPSQILSEVNRLLYPELSDADTFITAMIVSVDTRDRYISVAGAGHCPLLAADNEGLVYSIEPEGVPLGILPETVFPHQLAMLGDANWLCLYTDGVVDACDDHGQCFGVQRLAEVLVRAQQEHCGAALFQERLFRALDSFQPANASVDEQTCLVLAPHSCQELKLLAA